MFLFLFLFVFWVLFFICRTQKEMNSGKCEIWMFEIISFLEEIQPSERNKVGE